MISFGEGDKVYYRSPSEALPSGVARVVDVLVEGERTEPAYLITMGFGEILAAGSDLMAIG